MNRIKENFEIINFKGEIIAHGDVLRPDLDSKNTWFSDNEINEGCENMNKQFRRDAKTAGNIQNAMSDEIYGQHLL